MTAPVALVTGATGQDGGYLVERLLGEGATVHAVLGHPDEPVPPWLEGATRHAADLADATAVRELVLDTAPDEVYNLGAVSSVARSWEQPVLTAQVNALAVVALLDAALAVQQREDRPVRVLQASSAEVFGAATQVPQDERTPLAPLNPYGAAKAFAHQITGVYRARGLGASAVVLYNHESPRRPEAFVTRKITAAAARIARGEQDRLVLGDLEVRRDWGWAPDYVDAMVRAVRHPEAGDFVVATGETHSIADFCEAAFTRAGVPDWRERVATDPAFVRPADAAEQRGDATRAREVLGWRPTVGFEELVVRMVDHDLTVTRRTGQDDDPTQP